MSDSTFGKGLSFDSPHDTTLIPQLVLVELRVTKSLSSSIPYCTIVNKGVLFLRYLFKGAKVHKILCLLKNLLNSLFQNNQKSKHERKSLSWFSFYIPVLRESVNQENFITNSDRGGGWFYSNLNYSGMTYGPNTIRDLCVSTRSVVTESGCLESEFYSSVRDLLIRPLRLMLLLFSIPSSHF